MEHKIHPRRAPCDDARQVRLFGGAITRARGLLGRGALQMQGSLPRVGGGVGNLLPACEFCNCSAKRQHDVVAVPIVNPIKDRPGEHLYVCSGRFFPNDDKGKNTIEVLRLNDEVNLLCSRFKVCQYCEERLLDCKYWMRKCVEPEDYCKVARLFTAVLRGGLPDQEYSATVATFLMCEQRDLVQEIEQQLRVWQLWDEKMESTKAILLKNALPK